MALTCGRENLPLYLPKYYLQAYAVYQGKKRRDKSRIKVTRVVLGNILRACVLIDVVGAKSECKDSRSHRKVRLSNPLL
jgi:hypothetical protein